MSSERGSALLEALISVSIISMAAAALATVLATQIRSAKQVDERFAKAEVANSMLANVDCPETVFQACRNDNRRLYSTQGPLRFALPYQADRAMGATLDVRCENGTVTVHYALDSRRGEEVVPGGLCKRRFFKPKMCPREQILVRFDDETGKIRCKPEKE